MRASRLLHLLLLLQNRGRMTAPELATELEVSVRTIYRDVESLSAAGVPVYADRGPAGGYQLVDGYHTRLTGMTPDEADSLFLAGIPGPAAELGLGTVFAAAQLKVLAALPPELRSRANRVTERFYLDAPGWFTEAESVPQLALVADAVWNSFRIRVRYERWNRTDVERVLEPLGIVLKAGTWYLIAQVDGEPRMYRASRILEAALLDESFERPAGFDLAAYWSTRNAELTALLYKETVTVRLSPHGQRMLFLLGQVISRAGRAKMSEPDADGWVRTELPTESITHAVHQLLQLGPDVQVLDPPELRDRLKAAAAELVELYG
ncbi:YafY family protein [Fodinicola feengrottensis]|uniref:YafY family protein n=1 Tax=Fodinicola feengrottensis TaxID=435914 RepID=A0ABP4T3R7_9ACTN